MKESIEVNRENLQSLYNDVENLELRFKTELDGIRKKVDELL